MRRTFPAPGSRVRHPWDDRDGRPSHREGVLVGLIIGRPGDKAPVLARVAYDDTGWGIGGEGVVDATIIAAIDPDGPTVTYATN